VLRDGIHAVAPHGQMLPGSLSATYLKHVLLNDGQRHEAARDDQQDPGQVNERCAMTGAAQPRLFQPEASKRLPSRLSAGGREEKSRPNRPQPKAIRQYPQPDSNRRSPA